MARSQSVLLDADGATLAEGQTVEFDVAPPQAREAKNARPV